MATAMLFQVPLYSCYTSLVEANTWEAINPMASPGNLRTPKIIKQDRVFHVQTFHHYEPLYWESTHCSCYYVLFTAHHYVIKRLSKVCYSHGAHVSCIRLASSPGSLIMWGREREPGIYRVAHAPNVYANLSRICHIFDTL